MLGSSHSKDHGMGFLDELKDKAEEFGDMAKEGFASVKDKAEDVFDNAKDRFDDDDTAAEKTDAENVGETASVGATRARGGRRGRDRNGSAGVRPEYGRGSGRN
jgi:hypothetical protein